MINNGLKHLTVFHNGNNCKDFKTLLIPEFGRETKEAADYKWKSQDGWCIHIARSSTSAADQNYWNRNPGQNVLL